VVRQIGSSGQTVATGLGLSGASLGEAVSRLEALARDVDPEQAIVLIEPAPEVPYQDVVTLHDACEGAGLKKVGLGGMK